MLSQCLLIVQHGSDPERPYLLQYPYFLPDKPGELARVAQTVADVQGNIIKLEHNQFVSTNRNAAVELTYHNGSIRNRS